MAIEAGPGTMAARHFDLLNRDRLAQSGGWASPTLPSPRRPVFQPARRRRLSWIYHPAELGLDIPLVTRQALGQRGQLLNDDVADSPRRPRLKTTVRTTAAARGSRHRSQERAAGAKAKLRSTDRASGLSTSPAKYMKAMTRRLKASAGTGRNPKSSSAGWSRRCSSVSRSVRPLVPDKSIDQKKKHA